MQREPLLPQRFILMDKWRRADEVEALAATGGLTAAATGNGWSRLSPPSSDGRGNTNSVSPPVVLPGPSGVSLTATPIAPSALKSPTTTTTTSCQPPSSSTTKKKRKKRRAPPPADDSEDELASEAAVAMEAAAAAAGGNGSSVGVPERGRFCFELQRHCVRERLGSRSFRCDVCGGTYRHAFSLKRHYLRTHVNYVYLSASDVSNCNINLTAGDEVAREEFQRRLSQGAGSGTVVMTGLYRCNSCAALFDDLTQLKFHVKNHPDSLGAKRFPCDQCHMTFSHKQNLVRHLSVHSGEKPYSCKYCDKGFPTATNQRRHERIHEGVKPYPCPHCPSYFSQSGDLKKHIRKLHRDFFFPCAFCLKYCPNEMLLREHVLSHGKSLDHNRRALKKKSGSATSRAPPPSLTATVTANANAAIAPSAPTALPPSQPQPPPLPPPSVTQQQQQRRRPGKEYSVRCTSCAKRFANRNNLRRHQRVAHTQPARSRRNNNNSNNGEGAARPRPRPRPPALAAGDAERARGQQPLMPSKFFANVSHNIAHNLQHYIDGKLTPTAHHHRYATHAPPARYSASPAKTTTTTTTERPAAGNQPPTPILLQPNLQRLTHVALDLTRYNFPVGYDGAAPEETAMLSPGRRDASAVYDDVAEEEEDQAGAGVGCSSAWPRASRAATAAAAAAAAAAAREAAANEEDDYSDEEEDGSGALDLSPVRDPALAEANSSADKANSIILYLCYACGEKFFSVADIEEHKVNNHPNVYCTHLEIEGTTKNMPLELLRYQCSPVGLLHMAHVPPVAVSTPSAQLRCTKCQQSFQKTAELHEHILVCGVEQPVPPPQPAETSDAPAPETAEIPAAATSESSPAYPSPPRGGSKKTVNRGMKRSGVDNEAVVGVAARRATPPIGGGRKSNKRSRKELQSSTTPPPNSASIASSSPPPPPSSSERGSADAEASEEAKVSRTPTPVDVALLFEQQQQLLDEISLTCDGCNRKFKYASAMERHYRYCRDEIAALAPGGQVPDGHKKSHTCQHCSRSFAYVATLKRHMAEFCGSAPSAVVSPLVLAATTTTTTTTTTTSPSSSPAKKSKLSVVVKPTRSKKMARRRLRRRKKAAAKSSDAADEVKENRVVEPVVVAMVLSEPSELVQPPPPKADRCEARQLLESVQEHEEGGAQSQSPVKDMASPEKPKTPAKVAREQVDLANTAPSPSSKPAEPVQESEVVVSKKKAKKSAASSSGHAAAITTTTSVIKSPVMASLARQIKQEFHDKAAAAASPSFINFVKELPPAATLSPEPSTSRATLPTTPIRSPPPHHAAPTTPTKLVVPRLSSPPLVAAISNNPSSPAATRLHPSSPASSPPRALRSPLLPSSISVVPVASTSVPPLPASMSSLPSSISVIPLSPDSRRPPSDKVSSPTYAGLTVSAVPSSGATQLSPEPATTLTQLTSRFSPAPPRPSSPTPSTSDAGFGADPGPGPGETCVEGPDGVMIKVESMDDRREQQHTCPNCKRTFTYLANFKKHLNDLCPLRLIRRDESDPSMPLVSPEVVTGERGAEESDAGSGGVGGGSSSERPAKAAAVFPCTICSKEFGAYVVMLKHRLSHKLKPSGQSLLASEGPSTVTPIKTGGVHATLDWKRPYSWFGGKLQQSQNRGPTTLTPKAAEKPLQFANTGAGLQLLPGKPGRPIGSSSLSVGVAAGFTPVCHDVVGSPPSAGGAVAVAPAVVQKKEPEEPALGQSEWLDINAVLNMPDCYYDDEEVYAEPTVSFGQSTTLSETSSTITRALSSVYRSGALIHKMEESNPPSPSAATESLDRHHQLLREDERRLLEGGDELANLDD